MVARVDPNFLASIRGPDIQRIQAQGLANQQNFLGIQQQQAELEKTAAGTEQIKNFLGQAQPAEEGGAFDFDGFTANLTGAGRLDDALKVTKIRDAIQKGDGAEGLEKTFDFLNSGGAEFAMQNESAFKFVQKGLKGFGIEINDPQQLAQFASKDTDMQVVTQADGSKQLLDINAIAPGTTIGGTPAPKAGRSVADELAIFEAKEGIKKRNKVTSAEELEVFQRKEELKAAAKSNTPEAVLDRRLAELKLEDAESKKVNKEKSLIKGLEAKKSTRGIIRNILKTKKNGDLVNQDAIEDITGTIEGRLPFATNPFGQAEANVQADIDRLKASLTVENLSILKGTISDADLLLLENFAAGGLNQTQGHEKFISELQDIDRILSTEIPDSGVSDTKSEIPTFDLTGGGLTRAN